MARFGILAPFTAFQLFALGIFLGAFGAIGFGLFSLLRTWSAKKVPGRKLAWAGTLVGVLLFLALALAGARAASVPPIHDITTSPADPPSFGKILLLPENQGRDLTYPHGDPRSRERQEEGYPDLAPIVLPQAPAAALAAARRTAEGLDWQIIWESQEQGVLEATETTGFFSFVDDVVIRVRPGVEDGSVLDIRSTSRVGVSDMGTNTRRIRTFRDALLRESS